MEQKIYVKSILHHEDNSQIFKRLGLDENAQRTHNSQNIETSILYKSNEERYTLSIVSIFEYKVGNKAFQAFLTKSSSDEKDIPLRNSGIGPIQNFIDTHINEWNRPKLYLNLIRWIYNIDVVSKKTISLWSLDKENWYNFFDMWINGIKIENSHYFDLRVFSQLEEQQIFEPLAFEILNEAKAAISSAPRVALIIAATSLEIGVKNFIKLKSAETEWILDNIQSPPIIKLLTGLVSKLEPNLDFSKDTLNELMSLVHDRNVAIHLGTFDTTAKNAPKIGQMIYSRIQLVSDILYYLAYYSGHHWVRQGTHISQKRTTTDL